MSNKTIIITLVLVILAAAAWYYFGDSAGSTPAGDAMSGMRVGDNAIYAPDQKPGESVTVGLAYIADGGYVVIHAVSDGKPGAILGASALLPAGESQGISVALSRASAEGEGLIAMLHNDDGDGAFDPSNDSPVKDASGNVIMMNFTASSDAEGAGAVSI